MESVGCPSATIVFFVILALLPLTTEAHFRLPRWHELHDNYTALHYLRDLGREYASAAEHALRLSVIEKHLAMIRKHNADPTKTWKMGLNHLTDKTDAEFRGMLGYDRKVGLRARERFIQQGHPHVHLMRGEEPWMDGSDAGKTIETSNMEQNTKKGFHLGAENLLKFLPEFVDWRKHGVVSAVKDQGFCGSCWAVSSASTVESAYAVKTGLLHDLSIQQIVDCTENPLHCGNGGSGRGCDGGTSWVAYDALKKRGGIASEWTYPYTSYRNTSEECQFDPHKTPPAVKVTGMVLLPSNKYWPLMAAVHKVGPVVISVDASDWRHYEGGVFDGCDQENPEINHGVQLVGYGIDIKHGMYWLVRNSWSAGWGEKGYIRIRRTMHEQTRCAVDTDPHMGSGCDGGPVNVTVCGTCGILFDSAYPLVE